MLTAAETRLLDDISDDWYGLWEVNAGFENETPEVDSHARRSLVIALLQRGLVELRVARDWSEMPNAPLLQGSKAVQALTCDRNWAPPAEDHPLYTLAVTASGEVERLRGR